MEPPASVLKSLAAKSFKFQEEGDTQPNGVVFDHISAKGRGYDTRAYKVG